jgi:hypothetical protein
MRIAKEFPSFPWLAEQASGVWRGLPDDETLTIGEADRAVERTAREWAESQGAGLLAVPDFTSGKARSLARSDLAPCAPYVHPD